MSALYKILYNLGFTFFSIGYLPFFILKGKAGKGASSRFGNPPAECLAKLKGHRVIWLHAVSVGEIGLAVRWASQLKIRMPDARILFTTTTVAGYDVASKIKSEEDALCYFPIDWSWSVASFLKKISPSLVLFFETEIWPNLIESLSKKQIPIFIVNGRISDRALRRYQKVRGALRYFLNKVDGIGAQDEEMRSRFIRLGADASRVRVTGNLKFEWAPNEPRGHAAHTPLMMPDPGLFTWLCASTHEGEEVIALDIFTHLKERYPLRLILAPRHPNRFDSVEKLIQRLGMTALRHSRHMDSVQPKNDPVVHLIDKMGVLPDYYRAADAVFMGGSLVPVGGHNLVEPAYFGKPILYGPHMENFKSMVASFEKEQASCCVKDKAALEEKLVEWIKDIRKRVDVGEAARKLVSRHRGATQRNMDYVLSVFEQSVGRRLINV